MRASFMAAVPLLVALGAAPAEGQMAARLHVDLPIGRSRPEAGYATQRRPIVVREYDPYRYGAWNSYYDQWVPQTVYLYNGYYYDYPVVAYAQPIVVYSYRNEIFFAPRERAFSQWRAQFNYRDIGRTYRPIIREDRAYRGYQAPRDARQFRPAPQDFRNGRNARSAPQASRNSAPSRPGDRSRPRGSR